METEVRKKVLEFKGTGGKPQIVIDLAPEIRREEIEEIEVVGSGQYGDVLRGRCRGLDVAIKILRNKFGSKEKLQNFKKEVEIMSRTRFPNVCLLLGACTESDYFCIVQEYLMGGDLGQLCDQKKLPQSFWTRMRLASHVARGMLWIHSSGVLHRDLKLENLLMDKHGEVKVCDFGLADMTGGMKFIWDGKNVKKGSPLYMAPEVLKGQGLNTKLDVYSFGLVLWELLAQRRAFQHHLKHNDIEQFTIAICKNNERPPIPPDPSENDEGWSNPKVVRLLQRCWSASRDERPDFQEIYEELTSLVVEGQLKDDWARYWWLINFPHEDSVKWDVFKKTLVSNKIVELQDDTQFLNGLALEVDKDMETYLKYLEIMFAQISGVTNLDEVSLGNFGKILKWFGPCTQNNNYTFLHRMKDICSKSWFHGNISNTDASLSISKAQNCFLVRLGSETGNFTLQTHKIKIRIVYLPGQGYQDPLMKIHSNIDAIVAQECAKLQPLPGSPFLPVRVPPESEPAYGSRVPKYDGLNMMS